MTNNPLRNAFEDAKRVLGEIAVLREDLAEYKKQYCEAKTDPMSAEQWGDVVALARVAVTDIITRDKKATAEQRRRDLAEQMELGL